MDWRAVTVREAEGWLADENGIKPRFEVWLHWRRLG